MSGFKQRLLTGWHFMRVLRLGFAILFAVQAVMMKDWLVGLMSGFFMYQAVMNTGCCGETCAPRTDKSHKNPATVDITFEEVK